MHLPLCDLSPGRFSAPGFFIVSELLRSAGLAPELPENMAEALDAEGRLIAQFTPTLEKAPAGTAALRISSQAYERMITALEEMAPRQT